jgi:uncharacterized protein (TIGR00375 family)
MPEYADLHIHSRFSIGVSRAMLPGNLLNACRRKGISVVGSGDALHPEWQSFWEGEPESEILVVPSTEVEDRDRVHHLILMPEFSPFAELRERFAPHCTGIRTMGRPHLHLNGEAIAREVHSLGGAIGPSHAFTPWTSLYAYFGSVSSCYGGEPIDFLELGLSADSSYGASIPELAAVPFLSNSDSHSPDPARCGREYNVLETGRRDPAGVIRSVCGGRILQNVGFFPEEGKYNRTACTRCYEQYTPEAASLNKWRCPKDGGLIKKGVYDRMVELSTGEPTPRPPYLHMIPLAEIIAQVKGTSSPRTKGVRLVYDRLLEAFGNEIAVLTRASVPEIREIDEGTAAAIGALREGRVQLHPGGGGRYGWFEFT